MLTNTSCNTIRQTSSMYIFSFRLKYCNHRILPDSTLRTDHLKPTNPHNEPIVAIREGYFLRVSANKHIEVPSKYIVCQKTGKFQSTTCLVCFKSLDKVNSKPVAYFFNKHRINLGFVGPCIFTHSNKSTN